MEYCFSLADTFLRESTRRVAFKWQILVMLDVKLMLTYTFAKQIRVLLIVNFAPFI